MNKTSMKLPSVYSQFDEKPKTIEIEGELYQSVPYDSEEVRLITKLELFSKFQLQRIYDSAILLLMICIALVLTAVTICIICCIR